MEKKIRIDVNIQTAIRTTDSIPKKEEDISAAVTIKATNRVVISKEAIATREVGVAVTGMIRVENAEITGMIRAVTNKETMVIIKEVTNKEAMVTIREVTSKKELTAQGITGKADTNKEVIISKAVGITKEVGITKAVADTTKAEADIIKEEGIIKEDTTKMQDKIAREVISKEVISREITSKAVISKAVISKEDPEVHQICADHNKECREASTDQVCPGRLNIKKS